MAYDKPWLSYEEQLEKLKSRGMIVTNEDAALNYLKRIGYYRLSGYWYAFRQLSEIASPLQDKKGKPKITKLALDDFKDGTKFSDATELYVFDKRLRLLVMDALGRIEVALRVDISHTLGKTNPFAYNLPEMFHSSFGQVIQERYGVTKHYNWVGRHAKLLLRSKEEFIQHNIKKYGFPLPMWVACECWDFGTMYTLFSGMKEIDQDLISAKYGIKNGRIFSSWLNSLNQLRNVCAHHCRLWNRNITQQPKLPKSNEVPWVEDFLGRPRELARCFLLLRIILHILDTINPNSSWRNRMQTHLEGFPDLEHVGLNLKGMGVIDNWKENWSLMQKNS